MDVWNPTLGLCQQEQCRYNPTLPEQGLEEHRQCTKIHPECRYPQRLEGGVCTSEIGRFARKHAEKIKQHDNEEVTQLLDNTQLRRLKRTKPFELCDVVV
ncbi:hypothetical protein LSTR_LSTR009758 [Laodelphax striatellus]|uniref:Uncharacterized protein n=1 Tax=Laodelphax striatellus TaxID=195883 RepID=A0A482WI88_LAOST|nr:hypothetical protein LSTR_LSTR009758 [Laodelphax striatellus]